MKFVSFFASVALSLAAIPAAVAQNRAAIVPAQAEQLQVMADFLVPRAMLFAIGREMCDTALRTNLMADPALPEVEQRLPGIIDRMIKASSALCDVEMQKALETRQDQVRSDIVAQIPSADLSRVARMLASSVQEARNIRVEVRPGDTMLQIIGRIGADAEQEKRLRAAQVAFARTPGGAALLNKVHAYQDKIRPLLEQDQKDFLKIAADAYKIARREANLYAQEKGLHELYADAPVPPLQSAVSATGDAAQLAVKLPGSSIYVYSFLDVREKEYTPKVLDRFDAALTERFGALKVSTKILRYNKVKEKQGEFFANNTSFGSSSQNIPVEQTIYRNLAEERAAQTRYRLVIFPANFESAGSWRYYEIRFVLMDTQGGRRVFEYSYTGRHMVLLSESENSEARSTKILDAFFSELGNKGIL
jgi:hypothetical protein